MDRAAPGKQVEHAHADLAQHWHLVGRLPDDDAFVAGVAVEGIGTLVNSVADPIIECWNSAGISIDDRPREMLAPFIWSGEKGDRLDKSRSDGLQRA